MAFYPQINYLGAAQGIVNNWDQFNRTKLMEQEEARRAEEGQSLAKFRDMQVQKMQEDMDREKRAEGIYQGLAGRFATDPSFRSGVGERSVVDPETASEAYPGMRTERFAMPPQKSMGPEVAQAMIQGGLGKEGLSLMMKAQENEEKNKTEAWKDYQKGLIEFIKNKDNDGLQSWITQGKRNPLLADKIGPLEGIKVTPEGMEVEYTTTIPAGGKNPLSGETYEKDTKVDVKLLKKPGGVNEFKKVKEVEEKAPAVHSMGYGKQGIWNPETKKFDISDVPVNPNDASLGNALKELQIDKIKREEGEQKAKAENKAEEVTAKTLNSPDNWQGRPGRSELKPEALRYVNSVRQSAGKAPLKKVVETGRTEPGKIYGTNPLPDLYKYVPDETQAVPAPPVVPGGGLSGRMPVVPPPAPRPPVMAAPPPVRPPIAAPVQPMRPIPPGGGLAGVAQNRPMAPPAPQPPQKVLTREGAKDFLQKANGDRQLAEKMAREAGFTF